MFWGMTEHDFYIHPIVARQVEPALLEKMGAAVDGGRSMKRPGIALLVPPMSVEDCDLRVTQANDNTQLVARRAA
jgi:hypothetical protein